MPAIQLTYTEQLPIGTLGQVVNMETANSISRIVEDAAGIGFALAVFQGVNDLGVTATPGTLFKGVTIADKTLVPTMYSTTPVDIYPQRSTAGIHDKGVIWVMASVAVTAGSPAYYTSAKAWTNIATGNTVIPGATFDTSAASGALVRLRVR